MCINIYRSGGPCRRRLSLWPSSSSSSSCLRSWGPCSSFAQFSRWSWHTGGTACWALWSLPPPAHTIPSSCAQTGVLALSCSATVSLALTLRRACRELSLAKIPVVPYTKPKEEDDPAQGGVYCSGCAVCLDDFAEGDMVRQLPCQHVYHQACIDEWLIEKGRCVDQHVYHQACIDEWLVEKGRCVDPHARTNCTHLFTLYFTSRCPYCKMDFVSKTYPNEKVCVAGLVYTSSVTN